MADKLPGQPVSYYIAGPMRGYEQFNFPAFDEAASHIRGQGHTAISPAELDRADGFDETRSLEENEFDFTKAVRRDIDAICNAEAVAVLDGWEKSTGATTEVAVARWLKRPVVYWRTLEPIEDVAGTKRFSTGAKRSTDADGTRYDLITPVGLRRLAETYAEGAEKYGDNNWLAGIPSSDMLNHLLRHLVLWQEGDDSEDHLAHAAWGLFALMHFEERVPEMIQRPYEG